MTLKQNLDFINNLLTSQCYVCDKRDKHMKKLTITLILCLLASSQVTKNTGLFILSLTRYFQWPIDGNDKFFRISVYGDFYLYKNIMETTLGKNVGPLNIEVSQINRFDELKLLKPHIIVLSNDKCNANNISQVNKFVQNSSTLIICLKKGSTNLGADIELDFENENVSFKYNKENISNKGIKISKQLDVFMKQ